MSQINFALECFGMAVTLLLIVCDINEIRRKSKHSRTMLLLLALNVLVLSCDSITSSLTGMAQYTELLYACNFLVYSLGYVMTAVFTIYLVEYISERDKISLNIPKIINVFCAIAVLLVVVSLFNHMFFSFVDGIYQRGPLYWVSQAYPIGILIIDMLIIFLHRKALGIQGTISLMSYGILPMIAMIVQISVYGITLLYISTTLSLLLIYISVHLEQSRSLQQREKELSDAHITIMLSQIQPHFLYNCLASIKMLCSTDTVAAEKAIDNFAQYLRANMDSLNTKKCVSFNNELDHVKNYLALEKMRFDDNLNVIYNIEATNFFLPVLTIQPLVENAIKYGISGREDGGTVSVSSQEEENCFTVTVEDDGVGFAVTDEPNRKRSHIGIKNVTERLSAMCGATVDINSKLNVGTTITITIPKEKQ